MSRLPLTVNPCFPRSGHRFLRNICQAYLGEDFVFKSAHVAKDREISNATYIKDHDFGVMNAVPERQITGDAQYLVQYRHPLESMQSYFEFRVFHGHAEDSADSWAEFLPWGLNYWKAFVSKWCLDPDRLAGHRVLVLRYSDLYGDTMGSALQAITFLTGGEGKINQERLRRTVDRFTGGFSRYAEDQVKGNQPVKKARDNSDPHPAGEPAKSIQPVKKARDIRNFRYFDDSLYQIEEELTADYLTPLGVTPLLSGPGRD